MTLKDLSKFLTIIQVTSSEDKTIVMTTLLLEGKNIKSLLINIKNKKEYIQILEDEHRQYKHFVKQENYSHFNNILKILDWFVVKLDDEKPINVNRFN